MTDRPQDPGTGIVLDVGALAALRPRAVELAARIRAGDLEACFDGDELRAEARRIAFDAHEFVTAFQAYNDLDHDPCLLENISDLAINLAGVDVLNAALDGARYHE
jgi:hypothetical protein